MTIVDFIDAAGEQERFAPLGEGERMWSRLLASQEARYIREQEEAAEISSRVVDRLLRSRGYLRFGSLNQLPVCELGSGSYQRHQVSAG